MYFCASFGILFKTITNCKEGREMFRKSLLVLLFASLLLPLFTAVACAQAGDDKIEPGTPIILISLDTMRKDAVSLYGLGNGQTPNIDEFSKDAVVFNNAFSNIPHTLPSHTTMFTGLYPESHLVLGRKRHINDKVKIIPQYLKENGYKTAGVHAFWWLDPVYGFGRGYDYYKYAQYGLKQAPRVNLLVGEAIKELDLEHTGKFFLFAHYYDAHSDFLKGQKLPYIAPPILIKKYTQGYEGHFEGGDIEEGMYASPYLAKVNKDVDLRTHFPAEDLEYIRGLYAAGVEYLDINLGVLFRYLKKTGIYDRSLIIIVGDHGEEFLEHNMFIHEQMYDELLRVPLLIKFPNSKFAGKKVDDLVEVVDVLPTILDYAGIKGEPYIQGKSLLNIVYGKGWDNKEVFIHDPHSRKGFALRTDKDKLIVKSDNTFEYYDLIHDPKEKVPIRNPKYVPKAIVEELKKRIKESRDVSKDYGAILDKGDLKTEEDLGKPQKDEKAKETDKPKAAAAATSEIIIPDAGQDKPKAKPSGKDEEYDNEYMGDD